MASQFPNLFEPLTAGPVTLRNRIFSTGHMTVMLDNGLPGDAMVACHAARAKGPAGLKAAAVTAERGHDVTLYEAANMLGGQITLARRLPGRDEFADITQNLAREAEEAVLECLRTGTKI